MQCAKRPRSSDMLQDDSDASSQKPKQRRGDSCDTGATPQQADTSSGGPHLIFSQYEVLRTILSMLPLQDLRSAAQVCSTWKSTAKIILKSRNRVEWFFEYSLERIEEIMKTKLYSDPKICIMFTSHLRKKLSQLVVDHVGPKCATIQVQGSGIVGTSLNSFDTVEIEKGIGMYRMSAVLMPEIPGVTYRTFQLSSSKLKNICGQPDLTADQLFELTSIEPADEVKCLLMFCGTCSQYLRHLVMSVRNRQTQRLVVGGGVCVPVFDKIFGVALAGPNVVAASMLLRRNVTNKCLLEKHFKKFQEDTKNIKVKQTVCLMFTCVGRGRLLYNEQNVESGLFRKYFPTTPLIGYFGFGEFGCDSVPNLASSSDLPADVSSHPDASNGNYGDEDDDYLHQYSSVFVYLGFS